MGYFFGQRMIQKSLVFLCFLSSGILYAENIDTILQEYNQKNALSQKTIDENKGHLILFTREKLEEMHAKTLKDVFKTTPIIYYHENRFALPDPMTSGAFEPYRSNYVRLYVDGIEITQGWMGSGLMLYGDVNIDFVDHIEFYYLTPSFETSVEPAYLTVFLYSKDPKRDSGGKLNLIGGSRGYNAQSMSYGEEKEGHSYMVNFSHTNAKRETIDNGTSTPLSRDFERTQLFSYIKTEEQIFHLQVMKKNTDSLAGMTWDATPLESQIDYLNLHMDYGIDLSEHWHAQIAYDWLKSDMDQADELPLAWTDALGLNVFSGKYKNSTYSGEFTYTETIGKHHITAGGKGRYKKLDSFENFGQDALTTPFSSEMIGSIFFQDQYALSSEQLLTFGISHNNISRNGGINDDSLLQLRLGYLYADEHWSYKAYLYRSQFPIEPLVRYLDLGKPEAMQMYQDAQPQTSLGITQEFGYADEKQHVRLFLHAMQDDDSLFQDRENGLGQATKYLTSILTYDYNFNIDNKLNLQLYYAHYKDIFNLEKLEDISGYLSFANSYEEFDFYNGIVWHRNSINWTNYYDLTSSISWNVSEDLTVTLKGDNLLNKAKKTSQATVNLATTPPTVSALEITPIDQRIIIELEYMF